MPVPWWFLFKIVVWTYFYKWKTILIIFYLFEVVFLLNLYLNRSSMYYISETGIITFTSTCKNRNVTTIWSIDQSHRCGRHQAACREPAGSYDKTTRTAICFEHKMQYLLTRAPYTRIVIFWHIKLVVLPHVLYSSSICEILLYNQQLVVITRELICGVRAAIR